MDNINLQLDIYNQAKKITKQMSNALGFEFLCPHKQKILANLYNNTIDFINKIIYNYIQEDYLYYDFFKITKILSNSTLNDMNYKRLYISYFFDNVKDILYKIKEHSDILAEPHDDIIIKKNKIAIIKLVGDVIFRYTKSLLLINIYQCNKTHICKYYYPIIFIQPPIMVAGKNFIRKLNKYISKFNIKVRIIIDLKYYHDNIWSSLEDSKYQIDDLIDTYLKYKDNIGLYVIPQSKKIHKNSKLFNVDKLERRSIKWIFHNL